ncbi:alkaline phosphatase family protein [Alteromonas flava]|uniref:alkaline phosphatase family protein n=1 Tax=Alteromonas flava TaxID=2048003 RepID=UPI001F0C8DF6|nr:alkaline phosphatase family protein [Alteromonas flava]
MSNSKRTTSQSSELPAILAGPILRRVAPQELVVWLVSSRPLNLGVDLLDSNSELIAQFSSNHEAFQYQQIPVGERAFVGLVQIKQQTLFTPGETYAYRLIDYADNGQDLGDRQLYYQGETAFSFRCVTQLSHVVHGSCRKPHFDGEDALPAIDSLIEKAPSQRPDLLLMSGDQVYVDDVAGPMLYAVRQVIDILGLYEEDLDDATLNNSAQLSDAELGYYQREKILPKTADNSLLSSLFFGAKQKPIFTSVNAKNHLIAFSEVMAMYILVWSAQLWRFVKAGMPENVEEQFQAQYRSEQQILARFVDKLPRTARMLAHIPTYMIFDDHDVTDDWNLTRGWEEEVYGHPLSNRMVGNALAGYWLCQGWGNNPDIFAPLVQVAKTTFTTEGIKSQDQFIEALYDWDQWHYCLDTTPSIFVMDTRTRRWRSESNPNKPSGLLDWEALCEFQQQILGKDSVIVVSAAPIYGLKFIEAVQKVFTFFGKALMVDAENWMAHKGTAQVILNIFRHYKTPPLFMILSGDVHYSFVYDVTLRFRKNSPKILQFTCSGFKNAFPTGLLKGFERLNRLLYSKRSPLNYFTRRRNMRIDERDPNPDSHSCVLGHVVNTPAVGQLLLNDQGEPDQCQLLLADGTTITFTQD